MRLNGKITFVISPNHLLETVDFSFFVRQPLLQVGDLVSPPRQIDLETLGVLLRLKGLSNAAGILDHASVIQGLDFANEVESCSQDDGDGRPVGNAASQA